MRGVLTSTKPATVEEHQYHTNYGDISLPRGSVSTYSRFTYSIPLTRPNWGYFLKLFFGLLIFLTLAESTLSLKLWCRGQETGHNRDGQETGHNQGGDAAGRLRSQRLDRWSFAMLLLLYVGLSAAAVAWY